MLLLLALGCGTPDYADQFADGRAFAAPVEDNGKHPVVVHQPETLGVVDSTRRDIHGTPIGVACDTCHGPTPDQSIADQADVDLHGSVEITHGELTCNACHDADRTKLHLADGTQLAFADTMKLCAQCHGVQYRDYSNGSHGGMNGYWDLRQGPRTRNHCADCHSPHAPAYQRVMPVHPPRDRYLTPDAPHTDGGH